MGSSESWMDRRKVPSDRKGHRRIRKAAGRIAQAPPRRGRDDRQQVTKAKAPPFGDPPELSGRTPSGVRPCARNAARRDLRASARPQSQPRSLPRVASEQAATTGPSGSADARTLSGAPPLGVTSHQVRHRTRTRPAPGQGDEAPGSHRRAPRGLRTPMGPTGRRSSERQRNRYRRTRLGTKPKGASGGLTAATPTGRNGLRGGTKP